MSLIPIKDLSSLSYHIVDDRLEISRAVRDGHGNYFDISIGIDGANFENATIPPNLKGKIQIIVQGCLQAIQQQLAAQSKNVENLEQLGFIVQQGAQSGSYESHALVAAAGKSALDQIKACPEGNYSSLSSLYFGDTTQMKWPDQARKVEWSSGGSQDNYSVHDGLVQLCDDLGSDSVFGFSKSPTRSELPSSPDPDTSEDVDDSNSSLPLGAEDTTQAGAGTTKEGELARPSPPVTATSPPPPIKSENITPTKEPSVVSSEPPQVAAVQQRFGEPTAEPEDLILKHVYEGWQRSRRPMFSWTRLRQQSMWDRISLNQLRGREEIPNQDDVQLVQTAIRNGNPEIRQLFDEFKNVGEAYYRADFGSHQTDDERALDRQERNRLYRRYLHDQVIASIKARWLATWQDTEFASTR